jgi:hypothetical protein
MNARMGEEKGQCRAAIVVAEAVALDLIISVQKYVEWRHLYLHQSRSEGGLLDT